MKKRMFCIVLAVVLVISLFPATALAADVNSGITTGARSVTVGQNVYIGSDKLELGINQYGSFGTTSAAPSNFHPWSGASNYIGMRSYDVENASWDKTRDYFLPGTVDEGFAFAWSADSGTPASQKALVKSDNRGSVMSSNFTEVSITDQSTTDLLKVVNNGTAGDVVEYTQTVSISSDSGVASVQFTLKNTSSNTLYNLEWVRGFDPDQTDGNDPRTNNYYYRDSDDAVWVIASTNSTPVGASDFDAFTSSATYPFIFVAPASDDYTVVPVFQSVGWSGYTDFTDVTASSSTYQLGSSTYDDMGIGLRFELGTLGAGEEVSGYYNMSLDSDVETALEDISVGAGGGGGEAVTHNITYNFHDGNTTTVPKTAGTPIYVPIDNSTYPGYTFKGWTLTSESTTINYLPGSEFNVDANTTLYAVWEPIIYYSVTINGATQQVQSGTTATNPGTGPVKATEYFNNDNTIIVGASDSTDSAVKKIVYTFAGWKNQTTGQYWNFSTPVTNSFILIPDYSQSVFNKVNFDKNNMVSTYTTQVQWIAVGNHVNEITAPENVTSGATTYYFAGWNTKQNGTGEFWNFYGDVVNTNLTLYAQWTTVDAYNIEFDDNLSAPKSDYVWNTGALTQNGVAATGYVTSPAISRVDYVFEGWYTNSNCNASNAYNLNRTLSENNVFGLDTDSDKCITLYAKWTPKYTSENDILIDNTTLSDGTYALFYSDYINAYENNSSYSTPDATQIYRNFFLVNSNGTLVNPSVLPEGLHLNSRTGEIYGVPSATGGNTFYVRIANDDGKWISLTYPIAISIAKPVLNIDMDDDNTGLQKIYGSNDPGFYSEQLAVLSGSSFVTLDADGSNVTLTYSFAAVKATRVADEAEFDPSDISTLINASDLKDTDGSFVPDTKNDYFNMSLRRSSGEDAAVYKLFLTEGDITGACILNYIIEIADSLSTQALSYSEDEIPAIITLPEYVFIINTKPGISYNNTGTTVEYGNFSSGSDVKAALITGSGLVSNNGINVTDTFQSVTLNSTTISSSGKLAAGIYNSGFKAVMINTASPKGTSTAESATTTANYETPELLLTISPKTLTVVAANYTVNAGATFTVNSLKNLLNIDFVSGDNVKVTITSVTISGVTFDLTDDAQIIAANTALSGLTVNSGETSISISYSSVLTGTDADNYNLTAGSVANAKLIVTAPSFGGGGGRTQTSNVPVVVNGKTINAGLQITGTTAGGLTTTTVTVDTGLIRDQLAAVGSGATVMVPISGDETLKSGVLTGEMLKEMENNGATLIINTGNVQYVLPAAGINIDKLAEDFGDVTLSDIEITIQVASLTGSNANFVSNAIIENGYTLVLPPNEFKIIAAYDGKTVEIDTFSNYVQRMIQIPDDISPDKITTAVVVTASGTTYHVPTEVKLIDGKYYAIINSLTDSIYALVWNTVDFADTKGHWAQKTINNMGARTIINGVGNNMYEPDRGITRAEYAAILVRALGLNIGMGTNNFVDVTASDWYYGYVQTAVGYGLIYGYGDGTFGPTDTITREQAMTMIARAMKITGLGYDLASDIDTVQQILSSFNDGGNCSEYARQGIAVCIEVGIVAGKDNKTIAPKANITRAEVATIIERLLHNSHLI